MVNQLVLVLDDLVPKFGYMELAGLLGKFREALCEFWKKRLHPSPSISCESNLRMIKVELFVVISCVFAAEKVTHLDRLIFTYFVRKIARIEVCVERADEENKLRLLHTIFDVIRAQFPDINLEKIL